MSRIVWLSEDPFDGVAVSDLTSSIFDLRDIMDWSLSWYTTSGVTSAHTLQVSNNSAEATTDVVEASFVNDQAFGTGSPDIFTGVPVPVRWARILRDASNGSVSVELVKLIG